MPSFGKYTLYIMSNSRMTVLYTGVTSNLQQRYIQHITGAFEGFTKRYNCHVLIYFEQYDTMMEAIIREKYVKKLSRQNKLGLIRSMNPTHSDLGAEWRHDYESVFGPLH